MGMYSAISSRTYYELVLVNQMLHLRGLRRIGVVCVDIAGVTRIRILATSGRITHTAPHVRLSVYSRGIDWVHKLHVAITE